MVRNAILFLLFSLSAAVVKAVDYTNGGVWNDPDHNGAPVRYFVDNGCAIIGTEGGGAALSDNYYEYFHADRHLGIPSQIDGFAVVGIASNAFYQTSEGHPIDLDYSIPESVTNIGINAFGEYPEKYIVDGWLLGLNSNFYDGGTDSGTIVLPKCIRGIADGVLRQDDLHVKFLGKPPVYWPTRAPTSCDKILVPVEFENVWSKEIADGKWHGMYVENWDWDRQGVSLYDLKRDVPDCWGHGDYREWIVDDNGCGMAWYYSVTNTCRYRVRYDGEVERIEDESCLTNGFAIIQKSEDGHSYVNYLSDRDVILPSYLGGHPVREIGEGVFANSPIHATVMLSSNITVIGANAFGGSSITNITIPPSVTNIMEGSFSGCGYLGCQSLDGLRGVIKDGWVLSVQEAWEVPDGIKGIAGGAFAACSSVGVSLPTSVVYICNGAFACAKVYGVTVREGNPHFCSVDGTLYNADKTVLIRAGAPDYGNYGRFVVPTGVVDICDYAFFGNGLRDVTIPDTVRHIGRWAFAGCFDEGVTIKDGWLLTVVGDNYIPVRLPYNIRGIADGALHDRWSSESGYSYGEYRSHKRTFDYIFTLEFMGNPPTFAPLTGIGLVADVRLHSLFKDSWEVAINGTSTYDAVADTWVVTKPWIGYHQWIDPQPDGGPYQGPDEVGRMWWYSVVNGESIVQRPSVYYLGGYQDGFYFYATQNPRREGYVWLKAEVAYDECGEEIGVMPLVLPTTLGDHPVTGIGDGAFSGGEIRPDQIVLSSNIMSIGANAFSGCPNLRKVSIPACATNIGVNAFAGCPLMDNDNDFIVMDGWLLSEKCAYGKEGQVLDDIIGIAAGAFSECSTLTNVFFCGAQPKVCEGSFDGLGSDCVFTVAKPREWETPIPGVWCGHPITYLPTSDDSIVVSADKEDGAAFVRRTSVTLYVQGECNIYYTLDGSDPSIGSRVYQQPIVIEKTCTVKYFAVSKKYGDWGPVGSTTLVKKPSETDEITTSTSIPDGTRFAGSQSIVLTSNGSEIYYTTDCTDPKSSATRRKYDGPITLTETTTIAYYAVDATGDWSPVKTATYVWRAPDGWYREKIDGIVWGGIIVGGCAYDVHPVSKDALQSFDFNGDILVPQVIGNCQVVSLSRSAFSKTEITSALIPTGVEVIARDAFRECMSLTNVVIPASVTNIGYFAFRDCRKLKTIILNCNSALVSEGAFDGTPSVVAAPRLNGFVTVIAEIKGSGAISVPESWSAKYPGFVTRYGTDFAKALMSKSGKVAADGTSLLVWHDFVAGTDPTDENDQFTASITFDDNGKPIIKYTPELTAEQTSLRKYTTWGKVRLQDVNWVEVGAGNEAGYNFFKVTVEMRE